MKRIIIVVAVIIACLLALFAHLASSPKTLDKLATPALQRNAQNTEREDDAAKIASSLAAYISSHQNTFPKQTSTSKESRTLNICGVDCASANKVSVQLGYYANTPSAVSFHDYSGSLIVPDTKTVYIVPNANCREDKSGIGASTIGQKYLSIVVLYAIQSGISAKPQCLSPY